MSKIEKCCVLAIGVSSNVRSDGFHWDKVKEVKEEVLNKGYLGVKVIAWSSNSDVIRIDELREIINKRMVNARTPDFGGEAFADIIWKHVDQFKASNYDLYMTTDGQIMDSCYAEYVDLYNRLDHKPDDVFVYYIGQLGAMNRRFSDCFPNVTNIIHGFDEKHQLVTQISKKVDDQHLFQQLCELPEFERINDRSTTADDLLVVLQELYKDLYQKYSEYSEHERHGSIGVEFKRFVDHVAEIIHKKYIDVQVKDDADRFDDLFVNFKANTKEIFDIFCRRFLATRTVDYRKVLSQIIELGNGQLQVDRSLKVFGDKWYERVRKEMKPAVTEYDDNDDDNDGDGNDDGASTSNVLDENERKQIDSNGHTQNHSNKTDNLKTSDLIPMANASERSQFRVLWIGIDDTFGGTECKAMLDVDLRRQLARNSMKLFADLSVEKLNQRIPPLYQHISMEAFIALETNQLDIVGVERFKRIFITPRHNAKCFGLVLYNTPENDGPSLSTPMTQSEINIFTHNYATIAQLLFGDVKFGGSFPLLYTFFLQILKQCTHLEQSVKECVAATIERTSTILKCPFMLQTRVDPRFESTIKNAILFHVYVYPKEIRNMKSQVPGINAMNVPRKYIQYSSNLVDLAHDHFGIAYHEPFERQLKLWRFWHYMLCLEGMTHEQKMLHFQQIALSKIQNWTPIDCNHVKMMFIPGHSEKAYLDYLNDIDYDEVVKLIILYETSPTRKKTSYISTKKITLDSSGKWYNVKPIEKMDNKYCSVFEMEFCKTSCDFPLICPESKQNASVCPENEVLNLSEYGYPDCDLLQPQYYVQESRNLISKISNGEDRMQIPTTDELKKFIVSRTPLTVHPDNIDSMLDGILEKFHTWFAWYESASEKSKAKHLWIHQDWMKILKTKPNDNSRLAECNCGTHHHFKIKRLIRKTKQFFTK